MISVKTCRCHQRSCIYIYIWPLMSLMHAMHADTVVNIRCMPKRLGARDWQKLQTHLLEGNKLHTFSFFGSSLYQFQYIGLFVHACITYKNMSSLSVHAHVHTPQHNKYTHTHTHTHTHTQHMRTYTTHTRNTHTHIHTHTHIRTSLF